MTHTKLRKIESSSKNRSYTSHLNFNEKVTVSMINIASRTGRQKTAKTQHNTQQQRQKTQQRCTPASTQPTPAPSINRAATASCGYGILLLRPCLLPASSGRSSPFMTSSKGANLCPNSLAGTNGPKLRDGLSQHLSTHLLFLRLHLRCTGQHHPHSICHHPPPITVRTAG